MENTGTFTYSYSANQQEEVKNIREKYSQREESKLEQLRRLDQSVSKSGMIAGLAIGIVSSLIFGTGMACILEWQENFFAIGIVAGVIGFIGMLFAYPVYAKMTKKRREKLAPQIIKLSNELMQ